MKAILDVSGYGPSFKSAAIDSVGILRSGQSALPLKIFLNKLTYARTEI